MKWYRQPTSFLLLLLLSTSLVMTAAGLTLQHTVARSSEKIRDTLAIVVPIVLLRGDVLLEVDTPESGAEPDQKPDGEIGEQQPIESKPTNGTTGEEEAAEVSHAFVPVEENYFDTAIFIGDSRTVGLALYGRLGKADYFADVGMSTFNLFDKKVSDIGFTSQDLKTLLQKKQYKTIYLMLGINEVGYPSESIQKKFQSVINEISTLQPDAVIVLQANLGVTKAKEASSMQLSMERIRMLNEKIRSYSDDKRIFYLDINPFFSDACGYLRSDVTSDGIHPYALEYQNWATWLKEHGIQESTK